MEKFSWKGHGAMLLHFTLKHKERLKKLRENDEELPQRSRKEGNEEK